ncbi:hypothetical protein QRX60_36760 [Amycolatopsis mongoliensis]|uniref:Uncharacterized protein n=1 Tax=Amycolatopsis mongoliensis TaxID=715475 RepID=A0A9Y2NHC6_9PSEU|nr:hypothetical protein [Amycolatopsis sp. 4-36]WIX99567.1 hypothetical protein QRX60_36760 [Amycolatopsis sp. 4-36]
MPDHIDFTRMLLLAVDAWRYGSRDGQQQFDLQQALTTAVDAAGAAAGLDPAAWHRQPAGDGFLDFIADSGAELALVDPFVRELDAWLGRFNHDRLPNARLRLRLAIHHGGAVPAACGYAADGPVHVCRLRDAKPSRAALALVPEANLVQVLSEPIFGSVRQRLTTLSAADFTPVLVDEPEKEFREKAWIRVPGVSAERLSRLIEPEDLTIWVAPAAGSEGARAAALASFDAAGIPRPDHVPGTGDAFVVPLSSAVSGDFVLGVWVHHLHEAVGTSGRVTVSVGIAAGRDLDAARRLATGEPASAVLAGVADAPVVVVVSEAVHRRFVAGSGAGMVHPDSYRRTGTEPESWLRVPGYAMAPHASSARQTKATAPPAHTAGVVNGPVSNIGSAVIHGSYVNGPVYHGNGLFG